MKLLLLFSRLTVESVCGALFAIVGALTFADNVGKFFKFADGLWELLVLCIGVFLLWDTWRLLGQMRDMVREENEATLARGKGSVQAVTSRPASTHGATEGHAAAMKA